MAKRTDREFHIALGKLLDRVRIQNSWSKDSFINAATHVANISKSEARRFFDALDDMNLLIPGSDKRKLAPNFDTLIWKNEDKRIGLVKEVLELHPDIIQSRGRIKGKHYPKKEEILEVSISENEVTILPEQEEVNPLDHFEEKELVDYLRSKGWVVNAYKEQTVILTL